MTTSLIGGLAGAGLAVAVPGLGLTAAAGFLGGSMAAGLLFPERVEGPKLSDLKTQTSEYGRPIPIIYGTDGISGNVIESFELIGVESSEGGKGGPEVTTTAYFANFAVLICEASLPGQPKKTLGRIWASLDKRQIWDGINLEGAEQGAQIRFYDGSEDQLPDPLLESYWGVGNVPAYRGYCYIVFEHFPVKNDGNHLPLLTIEIGHVDTESAQSNAPEQLGVWRPLNSVAYVDQGVPVWTTFYQGSYYGFITRRQDDLSLVHHFTYALVDWSTIQKHYLIDTVRHLVVRPNNDLTYVSYAMADGAMTNHAFTAAGGADSNPGAIVVGGVYHQGYYIFAAKGSSGATSRITLYLVDPATNTCVSTFCGTAAGGELQQILAPADASAGYVYAVMAGTPTRLVKVPISSNFTPVDMGAPVQSPDWVAVDPNTGYVWSIHNTSGVPGALAVAVNDPATGSQIYSYLGDGFYRLAGGNPMAFTPGRVYVSGVNWLADDTLISFVAAPPSLASYTSLGYSGTATIESILYNPTLGKLMALRDGGNYNTDTGDLGMSLLGPDGLNPNTRYIGTKDYSATAVVTPLGQPLSEVVADLCIRAGFVGDDLQLTALESDIVDGYAIANQMDVKSAIGALQPVYYFDLIESGGKVKAVKRGGSVAVVIPDTDLGAYQAGSQPAEPLEVTRAMDEELPLIMNVRYVLAATKYDVAVRLARRLIGYSGSESTMDLAVVLSDTKAQEVAEVNLHGAWVARRGYKFSLGREYADLEPTDIVQVKNYTVRIKDIRQEGGRYHIEAVHDDSNVYVPNVIVTETVLPPPRGVETVSAMLLELM